MKKRILVKSCVCHEVYAPKSDEIEHKMMHANDSAQPTGWQRAVSALRSAISFLFWLTFLTVVLRILWSWTFAADSYSIRAFTSTAEIQSADLGTTVSDLVLYQLERIVDLHEPGSQPWGSKGEELPEKLLLGGQAFQKVGTISAGGMEVPVGEAVLALKSIWPHINDRSIISGSVHALAAGEGRHLVQIVARLETNGDIVDQWSVVKTIDNEAEVADLAKDIAYQIQYGTAKNPVANSWESFKYFTESIEPASHHRKRLRADDFEAAKAMLQKSLDVDATYVFAHYALGMLLYQNAYYEWDEGFVDRQLRAGDDVIINDAKRAKEAFRTLLRLSVNNPEIQALGHFGLGMVTADDYILHLDEKRDLCGSDVSMNHFDKATEANPEHIWAFLAHAEVLGFREQYEAAIAEMEDLKLHTNVDKVGVERLEEKIAEFKRKSIVTSDIKECEVL